MRLGIGEDLGSKAHSINDEFIYPLFIVWNNYAMKDFRHMQHNNRCRCMLGHVCMI